MTDPRRPSYWAETPAGIVTVEGGHFHTTHADARAFAPEVLDRYGMDALLAMATVWYHLPTAVGLITLISLLPLISVWHALWIASATWFFAAVVSPSTVFISLIEPVRWASHPVLQGLLYVLLLSTSAVQDDFPVVMAGLSGFIIFRWQLPERLFSGVVAFLRRPLSSLPAQDAILRNLMVRAALKHGYAVGGTDVMQRRILEIMNHGRKPRT